MDPLLANALKILEQAEARQRIAEYENYGTEAEEETD